MSTENETKEQSVEVVETVAEVPQGNNPEDLAAMMFQLFLPRFRSIVDKIPKKKLLSFVDNFVKIPPVDETELTDEIKQQIKDVDANCYKDFTRMIRHPDLANNARRRIVKMIVEFPIEGDNYKLQNAFEEKVFNLANNLLQAKFTIFLNNINKFEELQNSLNNQVKEVEKELLLLSNKLMYAKFIMILHTIEQNINEGDKNVTEKI